MVGLVSQRHRSPLPQRSSWVLVMSLVALCISLVVAVVAQTLVELQVLADSVVAEMALLVTRQFLSQRLQTRAVAAVAAVTTTASVTLPVVPVVLVLLLFVTHQVHQTALLIPLHG